MKNEKFIKKINSQFTNSNLKALFNTNLKYNQEIKKNIKSNTNSVIK